MEAFGLMKGASTPFRLVKMKLPGQQDTNLKGNDRLSMTSQSGNPSTASHYNDPTKPGQRGDGDTNPLLAVVSPLT